MGGALFTFGAGSLAATLWYVGERSEDNQLLLHLFAAILASLAFATYWNAIVHSFI